MCVCVNEGECVLEAELMLANREISYQNLFHVYKLYR